MAIPPEAGGVPPGGSEPTGAPAPGSPEDALRRLEQRLDRASEAAERLMAQVATEAARAANPVTDDSDPGTDDANPGDGADTSPQTPPAGWQSPDDEPPRLAPELDPFLALLHTMHDLIPPELQQRLIAALREVLLALRALIDWYLERIDRRRDQGDEVQDIPIL